jgi:phospholipase/lecithinase/hemolysin
MKSRFARLVLATVVLCASATRSDAFTDLIVFGDSLSDTGNIAAILGTDPNQVIANNSYVPTRPYGSGRFTNGLVWVDTFAAALGLSSENSLGNGGNNAYGGARVSSGGFPSLSLEQQLDLYQFLHSTPDDALYVVAGGGNDARDAVSSIAGGANREATAAAAAGEYAVAIQGIIDDLKEEGAVDIVVWNTPDVGVTPAALAAGVGELGTFVSMAMNDALAAQLKGQARVRIFDVFSLVHDVLQQPDLYGLTDVTNACGAKVNCDPDEFLFWDGIHPTSAGHRIAAQAMLALVPEPTTDAMLLAGILAMVWFVQRKRSGITPSMPA